MVAGDFNVNMSETEGEQRREAIVAAMVTEVLKDMSMHFFPFRQSWCRDGRTWSMIREGR